VFSVFFCILCVLSLPMYIAVYILFVYNFTDHSHRVETQLHLVNIMSHHIITNYYLHSTDIFIVFN